MFAGFIKKSGRSRAEWAVELGIGSAHISDIANGKKQPSLDLAVRIQRATGGAVPADSWVPVEDEDASPVSISKETAA